MGNLAAVLLVTYGGPIYLFVHHHTVINHSQLCYRRSAYGN